MQFERPWCLEEVKLDRQGVPQPWCPCPFALFLILSMHQVLNSHSFLHIWCIRRWIYHFCAIMMHQVLNYFLVFCHIWFGASGVEFFIIMQFWCIRCWICIIIIFTNCWCIRRRIRQVLQLLVHQASNSLFFALWGVPPTGSAVIIIYKNHSNILVIY
jgi:hypothetical protein